MHLPQLHGNLPHCSVQWVKTTSNALANSSECYKCALYRYKVANTYIVCTPPMHHQNDCTSHLTLVLNSRTAFPLFQCTEPSWNGLELRLGQSPACKLKGKSLTYS